MLTITQVRTAFISATIVIMAACASTAPPAVTHDGLVLQTDKTFAEVYQKPGATLTDYTAYSLAPCKVAFKKNWMRDQNQGRINLSNRVTQQDVDKIKQALSAQCDEKFRQALQQDPSYNLVEEPADGQQMLILQPAIVDLDISSPDLKSPSMNKSYTTSAGEMTLNLEISDAATGETLVRIVDRKRGMDSGRLEWTNSVTNKAEAGRILSRWSKQLRQGLDGATGS